MPAQNVPQDGREPVHAPGFSFHHRLDLACDSSATRHAVAYASDVLRGWDVPRNVTADALLIIDELVTNAVRHSGVPTSAGTCGLALWTCCGHLLIGVHDKTDQVPVLREVSLDAENGRGIQIVAGLSDGAWGYTIQPSQPGKLVWAQLLLPTRTQQSEQQHTVPVAVA
jgi:anti-sigma regulatory factor (Ser/Thr protein kinase)